MTSILARSPRTKYNARLVQEWREDTEDKGSTFTAPVRDGYLFITTGQAVEKRNAEGKLIWSKPIQKGVLRVYGLAATADGGGLLAAAHHKTYYGNESSRPPNFTDSYTTLVLKLDAEGTYCP